MREAKRWLDELPWDSPERQLLAAGRVIRPPVGAVDADWQALCVSLGVATATTAVATKAIATTAVAAKTASVASTAPAALATKAITDGLGLSFVAKSVAIGFAVGVSVLGAGTVVEHGVHRDAHPSSVATPQPSPAPRQALRPASGNQAATPKAAQPPASIEVPTARFPTLDEPPRTSKPTPTPIAVVQPVVAHGPISAFPQPQPPSLAPQPRPPSLLEQAHELAQVKRLIDSGATGEALRQLRANVNEDVCSALSEERDALYVQALDKSQRRAEAQRLAKRFLNRYPNSPHVEGMRRLMADE